MPGMIAYYRIDDKAQDAVLADQRKRVEAHAEKLHQKLIASYTDVAPDSETELPELEKALHDIRERGHHIRLIVSNLDRITSDIDRLNEIMHRGVCITIAPE